MNLIVDEAVFKAFALWSLVVVLKMFVLVIWTGKKRKDNQAFANPEDAAKYGTIVKVNCDGVERVRRNHLNDLENVLPYMLAGFFYIFTNPTVAVAVWHFRLFGASRVFHTIGYTFLQSNFVRGMSFAAGALAILSMTMQSIMFYCS